MKTHIKSQQISDPVPHLRLINSLDGPRLKPILASICLFTARARRWRQPPLISNKKIDTSRWDWKSKLAVTAPAQHVTTENGGCIYSYFLSNNRHRQHQHLS